MHALRQMMIWMGWLALGLGVLTGVLLLGAILAPGAWRPAPAEPPSPVSSASALIDEASRALLAGNLSQAQQRLEEALKHEPAYAPALLLRACLALEAGDTQAAKTALEQLREVAPERMEAQLLQRLLEHHSQLPTEGWRQSFLRAWTELGRPSFGESPLLPELDACTQGLLPNDTWEHASSTPLRLALVLTLPKLSEPGARWLIAQVPSLEDETLALAASAALLSAELPPTLHLKARAVVRDRMSRLMEASPQAMQPRLVRWWAETSEESAFNEQEWRELEALAMSPRWRGTSFSQTFQGARTQLQQAGVPYPGMAAYCVALWSNTHGATYLLAKRAEVTRKQLLPGSRQPLGRILWKVGSRLSEQSTVLERLVGLQLMKQGAMDMGDEVESQRVGPVLEAAKALRNASDTAALEHWPLPSLWEEVAEAAARDEWAHRREFASGS